MSYDWSSQEFFSICISPLIYVLPDVVEDDIYVLYTGTCFGEPCKLYIYGAVLKGLSLHSRLL